MDLAIRLHVFRQNQQPINRAEWRAQREAELAAEPTVAERRQEIEASVSAVVVEQEQRQPVTPKVRDKRKRAEGWWAKATYTNGYRVFALEYLTRQIRGHLTPAEQAVFFLIFDRTVWWVKEWETIRTSQFVNGSLPRADGSRLFWGTGLSERTVQRSIKTLALDGLVRWRDTPGGNGLQDYALPRVDLFRTLPRFAGVNISYEGRMFVENGRGGGSWQTLRL